MKMPIVYTEQYPKGLGHTVPELKVDPYPSVKLCGIETHACIRHTTMDLVENGFNVHVVVDACSSRSLTDRKYALEAIAKMGANMITTESVVLGLAPDSSDPSFKQLQRLCFEPAADTGL